MNRPSIFLKQKIFGIIFILISVFGGIFIFWYINSLKTSIISGQKYQDIYIASADINSGDEIAAELIEKQKIPEIIFSEKFAIDESQILGKKAAGDIAKGEIISIEKIEGNKLNNNSYLSFSSYIPDDFRAVSLPLNYYGDSSIIKVGDRIDIISTYYDETAATLISEIVLKSKEIILISNQNNANANSNAGGSKTFEGNKDSNFLSGTLLSSSYNSDALSNLLVLTFYLTQEETEKVFLALERGVLNLALCSKN